ncbi:clpr2b (chloroplast) [Auxenochlorella protothecoides x Auxenochlorella symbiontica]|jgi:ATP-dependent Clp protease protease subunit|uniref:ATP-dependent Clp protease proteolytic subunit n=1 Tax=Auxenochlorella protothecoides TaxID=3075 RepID=A0A023HHQ1_AUXPR|nr:proteolytic subunit 2 of clp protease [Auxenochlorella protothecoides]AGL10873.1 proteolytic subunit 2 of clp protease [Auxenochlorella protothecoides]AGN72515.1 ATP-dependent Clp protease proteolytic subunit [Auxenochlorella protothecoides]ARU77465.1 ATP-dependent Clp protease proteolytic subunit [Auxenochlorella protothecoides]
MPIGVPKVPFRLPGELDAQWVDLYNRLYRERVLFLCQDLEDELANQLIGIMLYLNAEEETNDVFLYINSPGGSAICGIAVFDAINYINAEVTTICAGTASSMASFVLAGGARGNRIALPHARVMLHQPEGGSKGQAAEVIYESLEVVRIRHQIGRIYAERTGQPLNKVSADLDRDVFLSAQEAKNYGIVDKVVVNMANMYPERN